jgi:uncharacterized protein (DUF983 family)
LNPSVKAALRQRCPKCGEGRLLTGFLEAAPSCSGCGLDLRPYDAGDGPAFLVILLAGAGAIGSVAIMLLVFDAAAWAAITVAIAVTLGLTFGLLPRLKCFLIAEAWARKSSE